VRPVTSAPGSCALGTPRPRSARPDVLTNDKGQPIAFEVQLARMPLTTITQRTAAYRADGITLVWVTSARELAF